MVVHSAVAPQISWAQIKRDPDEWAQRASLRDLVHVLKAAAEAYTNRKPRLTDEQFDVLRDRLEYRRPTHSFLKSAGAPVPKGRTKVKLPIGMFSLNKIKAGTGTLETFASRYKGPYIVSDKLDGLSLEYDVRTGRDLYTRGDGTYGQDVSHLVDVIQGIPTNLKQKIVVRGEAVISTKIFATKFSKDVGGKYENPRNLAAGAVNTLGIHAAASHLVFVAHGLLYPNNLAPSQAMALLQKLGFTVVPHVALKNITPESLSKILKSRKAKSVYEMDGLVVEQDVASRTGIGNPEHKVAFKDEAQQPSSLAKVVGIEWNVSKGGKLIPVILLGPVDE